MRLASFAPESFLPSRHRLYVRANQKIAEVVDRVAELERIRSIDEFQVVLGGSTATLEGALTLVKRDKARYLLRGGF